MTSSGSRAKRSTGKRPRPEIVDQIGVIRVWLTVAEMFLCTAVFVLVGLMKAGVDLPVGIEVATYVVGAAVLVDIGSQTLRTKLRNRSE